MSKPSSKKRAHPVPPAAQTAEPKHGHEHEHDDDIVVVPRGVSRAQYLFILGLMIFTLIIFTVGDSLQSSVSRGPQGGDDAPMTWVHPEHGEQRVDPREFIDLKRRLDDYFRVQTRRMDLSDDDVAVFWISDQLAREAGIEITDAELARAVLEGLPAGLWSLPPIGSKELYDQLLLMAQVPAPRFESTLRDVMRVHRYQTLVGSGAVYPKPDDVLAAWKKAHQEYAYDYVELSAADFLEAARAELPGDEELATWFEELPARQTIFRDDVRPERIAAEIVGWRAEGPEDAAALVAAYPPPAEVTPEELAREYFDKVRTSRFQRPEPDDSAADPTDRLYFRFEEVADLAEREAPIHRALVAWLAELQVAVAAGEEPDLEAAAATYGLFHQDDGELRDNAAWTELEGIGGTFLANAVRAAGYQPSNLAANVASDVHGLFVARVVEKLPAGLPPMADMRERVAEEWTRQRAAELASERLGELRSQLALAAGAPAQDAGADPAAGATEEPAEGEELAEGEVPADGEALAEGEGAAAEPSELTVDEATFRQVAEAAGFAVGTRDWLGGWSTRRQEFGPGQVFDLPISPLALDPQGAEPANAFIAGERTLEELPAGGVSEPMADRDNEHAYLVRARGPRDPQELRMARETFEELRSAEADRMRHEWGAEHFSAENFRELYGLHLRSWDYQDEDELAEDEPMG